MKIVTWKPIVAIVLVLALVSATSFAASSDSSILDRPASLEKQGGDTGAMMLLDVALVRPISFVGLVMGSVTWLVAAPFALMADGTAGIEKISRPLVVEPAKYTFKRSVGDL